MDRWTMEELQRTDDIDFAICILNERRAKLTPYSPLGIKLSEAAHTLAAIKEERDKYIARITPAPAAAPEEPDVSSMTEEEYAAHRAEQSRRALMELIAKVERPDGDALSNILITAVNAVEALQAEEKETEE